MEENVDIILKEIVQNVHEHYFPIDNFINGCDDIYHNKKYNLFYSNGSFSGRMHVKYIPRGKVPTSLSMSILGFMEEI